MQHFERADFDLRDVLAVSGVKVRRRVVGPVLDDDPLERGEACPGRIVDDCAAARGALKDPDYFRPVTSTTI